MKRIVLTGGPGSGKTVISERIVQRHPDRLVLVPEAATQIYAARQTRWDKLDTGGRRGVQRQIYRLQVEQEQRIADQHPGKALLLDRGTVDGAAYWPDGPEDYWRDLDTSMEAEMKRYDLVIWMETCAALGIYDGDQSNSCRFEDVAAAVASGKALLNLWEGHENLRKIGAFPSLEDKIAAVQVALRL